MKQNDEIKELFAQKLKNHEAPVNPELWNAISSKIAANAAASSGSLSIGFKILISTLSVAVVATVGFMVVKQNASGDNEKLQAQNDTGKNQALKQTEQAAKIEEKQEEPSLYHTIPNSKTIAYQKDQTILTDQATKGRNSLENTITNPETNAISESKQTEQAETIRSTGTIQSENKETGSGNENSNQKGNKTQEDLSVPGQNEDEPYKSLPNVFTPNSDGENDYFWLKTKGLIDFSLTILNDRNQVVYSSSDPEFRWDGKDMGNSLVPQGNYIYYFTGKTTKGDSISKFSKLEIRY